MKSKHYLIRTRERERNFTENYQAYYYVKISTKEKQERDDEMLDRDVISTKKESFMEWSKLKNHSMLHDSWKAKKA